MEVFSPSARSGRTPHFERDRAFTETSPVGHEAVTPAWRGPGDHGLVERTIGWQP